VAAILGARLFVAVAVVATIHLILATALEIAHGKVKSLVRRVSILSKLVGVSAFEAPCVAQIRVEISLDVDFLGARFARRDSLCFESFHDFFTILSARRCLDECENFFKSHRHSEYKRGEFAGWVARFCGYGL